MRHLAEGGGVGSYLSWTVIGLLWLNGLGFGASNFDPLACLIAWQAGEFGSTPDRSVSESSLLLPGWLRVASVDRCHRTYA